MAFLSAIGCAACRVGLALALGLPAPMLLFGEAAPQDLTQASLEDLMNIQVTSVSKKEQKLSKTGASVYVITQDDIRRSGMMNIPDLLRIVPGVDVARIDANTWAISIRGFNNRYSNKVLVLIDGRSVYSSGHSGVFWDQQDLPLENIDRIEVVRGPGGTVWGANAVNGVINIITKSSKDTQGGLVTASTGNKESLEGLLQYGGKIGKKGTYRAFGRYFNIENSEHDGSHAADGWHGSHGGFRSDWDLSPQDTLTVQGDLFQQRAGQTLTTVLPDRLLATATFNDRMNADTGNVLSRWNHTLANGSETSLQVYYQRFSRYDQGYDEENDADADFQYHFRLGSRQDLVAGAGYRFTSHDYRGLRDFSFDTPRREDHLFNTFLQDEIQLSNSLSLTLGSKFEHNSYTGFEFEPSGQLVWSPSRRQTLWASAAQAIRQPSWLDYGSRIDAAVFPVDRSGTLGLLKIFGTPNTKAEQLRDYEAGYRAQMAKRVSLDISTFLSYYRRLQTLEPRTPFFEVSPAPPHLVLPSYWDNRAHARNYGAEVTATWSVTNRWRLTPGYSLLQMKITRDPSSQDSTVEASAGTSPKHQAQLRSSLDLARKWSWDTSAYFVGALQGGAVPGYTRLDTRLGWRPAESLEFSVAGQNLLSPRHLESLDAYQVHATDVERSIVAKVSWRF